MTGGQRVLVTRPEPGASETARRLERMGFLPITLPLHEVRSLTVDTLPPDIAAVAVTSANAIRLAPKAMVERLKHLPCFAVGGSTAAAARDAGFPTVIEGAGDAESLAQTIIGHGVVGPLGYLCGRVRRATFEERLAGAGIPIHAVETYDTIGLDHRSEEIINLTARHPIDYALLYSANAAGVLAATIRRPELEDLFKDTIFACLSVRVAEALGGLPDSRIRIAGEPNEPALLSLLGGAG